MAKRKLTPREQDLKMYAKARRDAQVEVQKDITFRGGSHGDKKKRANRRAARGSFNEQSD